MRTALPLAIVAFFSSLCTHECVAQYAPGEVQQRLQEDLTYLSSDELEGRDSGSEGIKKAAQFIVERFNALGIQTDKMEGDAFQNFSLPGPAVVGPAANNYLTFSSGDTLKLGTQFNPLALGNNGSFEAEVVFAGYGITARELEYDDYAGIDATGKLVIVLRKEPQQNDENSIFNGTDNSQYAFFSSKELNAALHKAAGLIIVNDSQTIESSGDQLLSVAAGGSSISNSQVPTFYCSRDIIDSIVKAGTGKTLAQFEQEIDSDAKPRSQILKGITAKGETLIEDSRLKVRNVVGFLPGKGDLADEFVVVGAHYDHVGMGGSGSLAPGTIAIHNGADDNGSGTTTMLEVARRMSEDASENRRSLIFMAFTAEEKGLLGSRHYVRNPRWPLEDTVAMINMDMVGRLNDNETLTVYGTGTAAEFDEMIDRLNEKGKFNLVKDPAGYGPSDHQSFYEQKIPVFHFFTGLHNQYHRPSDDVELVNFDGMARIADMVTDAVLEIATNDERPTYLSTNAQADVSTTFRTRQAPPRAIIGIQLDSQDGAARTGAVTVGGPADKAGMKPGDVILKIGETEIDSVATLQREMRGKRPGSKITLEIQRGTEKLTLEITLGRG